VGDHDDKTKFQVGNMKFWKIVWAIIVGFSVLVALLWVVWQAAVSSSNAEIRLLERQIQMYHDSLSELASRCDSVLIPALWRTDTLRYSQYPSGVSWKKKFDREIVMQGGEVSFCGDYVDHKPGRMTFDYQNTSEPTRKTIDLEFDKDGFEFAIDQKKYLLKVERPIIDSPLVICRIWSLNPLYKLE
jgi:hypothetical protein